MALDKNRQLLKSLGQIAHRPVAGAVVIYQGALVGINPASGYARPFNAGDVFAGHAEDMVDATNRSPGEVDVRTLRGEYFAEVAVTGLVVTSPGAEVYASDDETLTMTGTPGTDQVGVVDTFIENGRGVVKFTPPLNG